MFSATFPREVQRLASDFLRPDYVFLAVGRVGAASRDVTQHVELVERRDKPAALARHLDTLPSESLVLVFVGTKREADALEFELSRDGIPASSIHGDRTQQEREAALAAFKAHRTPVLVATDVASRGLDVPDVTHVFNYDMPASIDDYVHRIGRTGRAGNTGTAISFVTDEDRAIAGELHDLLAGASCAAPRLPCASRLLRHYPLSPPCLQRTDR
jgi:ATP-dependent RNA helicase DDX3X